jgi:predicted oxidoreductase
MKYFQLAGTDLKVSNVVAGMMRIPEMTDEQIRSLVAVEQEVGINFFDHADVYGGGHLCERRFAEALKWSPAEREQVILQTKAGIVPTDQGHPYFDFSATHIVEAAEESLRALATDYIDILLLHRPDALVEPEEVAKAFDQLESQGKARHFGVSNHTPLQIELLKTAVRQPLIVNQLELSITHAPLVAQGLAANMQEYEQSTVRDGGGLMEYCRLNNITVQAWSPFQYGFGNGTFIGDLERAPKLNKLLDKLAAEYGVDPMAIATAWIARHPANIQIVLGTTNEDRVRSVAAGSSLELTRPQWYGLVVAAGYLVP